MQVRIMRGCVVTIECARPAMSDRILHTRVAGNEVADHLAKLARDTALQGDGVPVLRAAKDEYSRLTDAHHGVTHDNDLAPDSAKPSDSTTSSANFSPPVVVHSLGVG